MYEKYIVSDRYNDIHNTVFKYFAATLTTTLILTFFDGISTFSYISSDNQY